MLRAVAFDLDDTLSDHRGLEREVWSDVCAVIAAAHPDVDRDELAIRHRENLEHFYPRLLRGELDDDAFHRARLTDALVPSGVEPSDELVAAYVGCKRRFLEETWPAPGAAEAIAAAHAAGLAVAVLTNGTHEGQTAKLARLGLEVDRLVTSERAGALKPDREAFAAVEVALGVGPAHLAMVGDNLVNDIEGALRAGWSAAVHVRGNGEPLPPGAVAAADAYAAMLALGVA